MFIEQQLNTLFIKAENHTSVTFKVIMRQCRIWYK